MQQIAQEVGQILGIGQQRGYSLFKNQHKWYIEQQSVWGADDVFEAELATLFKTVGQKAILNDLKTNMGVSIIGSQLGNVNKEGLAKFSEIPNRIFKQSMQDGSPVINKTRKKSDIISSPTYKSAKVDVSGYSAQWVVEADINPIWNDFIQTFTNARFTVKNYSSTSKNEVIHIGNSNLYKAFYGTLTDSIGLSGDEAVHIYYHTIYSNIQQQSIGQHIIHIRFMYELTGNGLYDSQNNKLDEADFFIYNDPASNNIFVRSTKAMILQIVNYVGAINDPLHSGIVILKQSFN